MAISKVKSTFSTYTLDDSTESKNFHRVLFKPGVSVQARELTELQTNLQRQIDYHGQYTFADGQRVTGGELALDIEYDYIKLESAFTDGTGTYTAADFISTIASTPAAKLTNANGVEAEVLQVISEAGVDLSSSSTKTGILASGNVSDPLTIYVKYIKGSGTTNSNVFAAGETLTASTNATHKLMIGGGANIDNSGTASSISGLSVGQGSKVTINEGVYFLVGNFVYVSGDQIILEKYGNTPSNIVGLNVTESVVTSVDDTNLVDNATGYPNFSAPGAERYKIGTELIQEPLASPNSVYSNYLTLLRVENGIISKKVAPAAAIDTGLTRRLANRTYEEAGNYSLKPFVLDIKEHLDNEDGNNGYKTAAAGGSDDKFVVGIEPNVAYVQGFRTENITTKFIEVDKPRETNTDPKDFVERNSSTTALKLGNYIKVDISNTTNSIGLPDITNFSEIALQDTTGTSPNNTSVALVNEVLGTANGFAAGTAANVRTAGTYTVTDNGSSYGSENCKSVGGGSGAKFKITVDQNRVVTVEVVDGGSGYAVNDTFTVKGTAIGGAATTAQDLTFDVAQLGVGRARVRAITAESSTVLRLYLFDVVMTKGQFTAVDKVEQLDTTTGGGTANEFRAKLVSQIGDFVGKKFVTKDNSYVWKLPYYGMKTVQAQNKANPVYQVQKRLYVNAADSSGSHTFEGALASDETLISTAGIILSVGSGGGTVAATVTDATASASGQDVTIAKAGTIATTKSVCAIITVQKTGGASNRKQKTINTVTNQAYTFDGSNPLPLDKYDIYKLVSVKQGSATGPDITNKFQLDNGQRANYYDEGSIIPISNVAAGTLYLTFMHYTHGASGEFLTIDSYPADDAASGHYRADTPSFRLPSGEEVDLKNCIDFRPVKGSVGQHSNLYSEGTNIDTPQSAFVTSVSTNARSAPAIKPATQFTFNGQSWLARVDKIVLSRDGEYSILKGLSAENPVPVEDPADSMTIGTIRVKPYVYDAKVDVLPTLIQHKRYTMKHIADLDKRIKKLEYYASLSLMEQETFNISLNELIQKVDSGGTNTYTDTVERFKNGIFTDQFKGHANGAVSHPNYKCSIDSQHALVRPMFDERSINLIRDPSDTGSVAHNRSSFTLPFTSTTFIDQPNATETEFINPYNMFIWSGTVRLSPDSDEWKDVDRRPDLIINDDSQYDQLVAEIEESGILGYQYNEWETQWIGQDRQVEHVPFDRSIDGDTQWRNAGGWMQPGNVTGNIVTTTTTTGQSRDGLFSFIREDTVTTESGDRIVEINYIPYIRSREVFFTAELMKPNTKLYVFFNGVDVTNYCSEKVFVEFTDQSNVVEHTNKTQHPDSGRGNLVTDSSGRITGSFIIPNNRGLHFKAGERTFKITDSPTNDTASLNDETTYAETVYRAQGLMETKQNTVINTKVPTVVSREVSESRVLTDINVSDNTKVQWFDPLAQSILIKEKGGVFVTELDIFLNTCDPNIPINVSIREMLNGYPTQKVVPGTDTVIYPSAVASGTETARDMVIGERYRIKSGGGSGAGKVDFVTLFGAYNNNPGTVFRVPPNTEQTVINNLSINGKVDKINTIYTGSGGSMISNNASAALPVTFANPVYLSQDQEYAIVLMSNSDIYKLFVTTPGKTDLTTNVMVDGNHYGGSFFMSQNASTWTADPARDLKFKLKKAVFDSSATLKLVNDQIPVKELENDPFLVCTDSTGTSAVLRVTHPNHGMMEGSKVVFSGANNIAGLGSDDISDAAGHTISDVERDSYCVTITYSGTAVTANTYGGGDSVTATENMTVDALVPYSEFLQFPGTNVTVTFDSFSGQSIDGSQGKFVQQATRSLLLGKTNYLPNPVCIASTAEHAAATGSLDNSIATNKSFAMNVTLSTTNPNLSPLLDGDRTSLFCISNRTNSAITASQIGSSQYNNTGKGRYYVPDTAAKGNSNINNYITREITLANEATHLNFYADVFKPEEANIILYYKAQTSGDDTQFDDLPWTRLEPKEPITNNDTAFGEVEYEVKLSDVPQITDTFSSFAFKIVMTTTNSCRVPMISNVRAIAST